MKKYINGNKQNRYYDPVCIIVKYLFIYYRKILFILYDCKIYEIAD